MRQDLPPMPFRTTVARRFPLPDTGRVEITSDNGPIFVEGWQRDEVALEVQIRTDQADKLRQVVPRFAATSTSVRLTVRENYTGIAYDYRRDGPKVNFYPAYTTVTLRLPRTAALKLQSSNGNLEIRGMRGSVDATTFNGRLLYFLSRGADQRIVARTFNGRLLVPEPPFTWPGTDGGRGRLAEARLGAGTQPVTLDAYNGQAEVR